jgi:nitroreductase
MDVKKINLFLIGMLLMAVSLSAQDIALPAPAKSGGKPLMDALNERKTIKTFSGKELDKQNLSNLLWAAYGFNRENKRVVPSSENRQEIDLYVALPSGVYFYDAKANILKFYQQDVPKASIGQPAVTNVASLTLIYVANVNKASSRETCYIDTGYLVQNVYLYCASAGIGSVARGSFNAPKLQSDLKLTPDQIVTLVQAVGIPL